MQFIEKMKKEGRPAALEYGRKNFQRFGKTNIHEIEKLMASLLFFEKFNILIEVMKSYRLEKSPYAYLYQEKN